VPSASGHQCPGRAVLIVALAVLGLAANDEVTAFHWAAAAEVTELTDEAYAVRVLDALRETADAAVRAHDGVRLM
jgi:hypothetical protein